jgi:hypothetical protein
MGDLLEADPTMKVFRGLLTELQCSHCQRWIRLQTVRLVRKFALPGKYTDGKDVAKFRRTYECPACRGIILRCPH